MCHPFTLILGGANTDVNVIFFLEDNSTCLTQGLQTIGKQMSYYQYYLSITIACQCLILSAQQT